MSFREFELHPTNAIRFALVVALAALIVAFHYSRSEYEAVVATLGIEAATPFRTVVIPGAPLHLGSGFHVSENHTGRSIEVGDHAHRLILVYSTTCPACKRQLPTWLETVPSLPLTSSDRVDIVGLPGARRDLEPMLVALRANDVSYRYIEVDDTVVFSRTSGIRHTPMIILADSEDRVLFAANEFTAPVLRLLREALLARGATSTSGGLH